MKYYPFIFRQGLNMGLAVLAAYAISLLADPPPREPDQEEAPVKLLLSETRGYDPADFAQITLSTEGSACSHGPHTAVRKAFGNATYEERSKTGISECILPLETQTLEAVVSFPYKPHKKSVRYTFHKCSPFTEEKERWVATCNYYFTKNKALLKFEAREHYPPRDDDLTNHGKVDSFQILLKREGVY